MNSIEIIDARSVVRRDQASWEIIEPALITPRMYPLVAPFSTTEVFIAGGYTEGLRFSFGDGFLFDLNDKSVRQ